MAEAQEISWLHLSDLHAGLRPQGWLWPNVKSAFLDDLRRLHKSAGPWDLVIFSGDMVQKGDAQEFSKFDEIISEIWQVFQELGLNPPLFVSPGNHDLVRPDKDGPAALVMKRWFQEESVREGIWDPASPYRALLEQAFAPFRGWVGASAQVGSLPDLVSGIFPGDVSTVLLLNGLRVGLVSLNSTWLQLSEGNYEQKLHIDVRQLLAVTGNDPEDWCRQNHINFLVTHHPPSWLEAGSLEHWQSEINPPGRFDAHLYGHMHTGQTASVALSGSLPRSSIQGPSLFGLEKLGDGSIDRRHGYVSGRLQIVGSRKSRTIWPRVLVQHTSGKRRMIPDHSFELEEDNSVRESYDWKGSGDGITHPQVPKQPLVRVAPLAESGDLILDKIRHALTPAVPHAHVRLPEQGTCSTALDNARACWLHGEWGMGSDGFLWAVQRSRGLEASPAYLFDFQGYISRSNFLDQVKEQHGHSFEQFCELISVKQSSLVIFDEVPFHLTSKDPSSLTGEIEALAKVVLEYCPNASVILRCRRKPSANKFPLVEVRPLEEADTALYIRHSGLGGVELGRPTSALKIHRHTAGAPVRIDAALKQLQVVRLSELVGANPDYAVSGLSTAPSPAALVRAVEDLHSSSDPILRRAYELLKTLSVFPYGEQLNAVRRFNNSAPFFPPHATILLDRGLITASSLMEIGGDTDTDNARLLTVPKSIRDYLRGTLKASDLRSLDRKALDLYFGSRWRAGALSFTLGNKSEETLQSNHRIANAHALVLRLVREATEDADSDALSDALRVTGSYLASLLSGSYYRSVVSFCGDLFETLGDAGSEAQTEVIRYQYARSLRMIGEVEQAREMLVNLDLSLLPKDTRQSALINLALAHQSLEENEPAREAAAKTIALGRYENAAIQAEAVLVELDEPPDTQIEKLKALEERAKRKKALRLANTIAISRANLPATTREDADKIFEMVSQSARSNKDFYNEVRAIIQVAKRSSEKGGQLNARLKSRLIDAYHFLFNERLSGMFDGCHEALWMDFEQTSDLENLLRLFRHSSLVWRLRDSETKEQRYVKRLASKLSGNAILKKPGLDREHAYFTARAGAALIENKDRED